jgi:hypothetical protein
MVVEDSVVFVTNGNIQDVKLVAWGQDVNVINGEIFNSGTLKPGNLTWFIILCWSIRTRC